MVIKYNKAIRDKIPEIIRSKGLDCEVVVLDDEDYLSKLEAKLTEELDEYYKSHDVEELADILEVLFRIADLKGVGRTGLEEIRKKKSSERGGFEKNLYLIETSK